MENKKEKSLTWALYKQLKIYISGIGAQPLCTVAQTAAPHLALV